MPQVSAYHEAPYQGVSQAPPQVRLTTQATALENALIAIPEGAKKRPPFDYLGMLTDEAARKEVIWQTIEHELGDLFLLVYYDFIEGMPGDSHRVLKLFRQDTLEEVPVDMDPDAQTYLDRNHTEGTSPHSELRVLTVADYTFIANRQAVVLASEATYDLRPYEGMIWVRQSAYGRTYKVEVKETDGTLIATGTYKTPNGEDATHAEWIDTDTLARILLDDTVAVGVPTGGSATSSLDADLQAAGFNVDRYGSVIYISRTVDDGGDFRIFVEDGQAGSALAAIKDRVQTFSDLPKKSTDGMTVRVTQQSGESLDDFFVHYVGAAGDKDGVWEECVRPGALKGFRPDLMPVGLLYDPALTPDPGWVCKPMDWKRRLVGDESLSPDPDFTGQQVEDLTFWRGRLAIIAGEGCSLSAADDPFRFYPATLATVRDDDPVSLVSPYPDVSVLRYAIPFEDRLILFGDICQLQVTAEGVVTPNTTRIDLMATYEFDKELEPQASNGKIYFGAPKGGYATAVYELAVDNLTNVTGAEDMVTAVPRYLPPTLNVAANCPVEYMIAYTQARDTSDLYMHLFRHANGERVQNAWSRWSVPEGWSIGGAVFHNTTLFLYVYDGTRAHVVKTELAPNQIDDGEDARILTYLDFRMKEDALTSVSYSAVTDRTTLTLPFEPPNQSAELSRVVVRAPGGTGGPAIITGFQELVEGQQADIVERTDTTIVLRGKWDEVPIWVGWQYSYLVELSRLYALGADSRPIRSGRLSIRRVVFDLNEAGYLRVEVTARGRDTRSYVFEGYRLDDPESIVGQAPSSTTTFSVPVMTQNEQATIRLVNDSHFGCSVIGYEWVGDLNVKAGRMT